MEGGRSCYAGFRDEGGEIRVVCGSWCRLGLGEQGGGGGEWPKVSALIYSPTSW